MASTPFCCGALGHLCLLGVLSALLNNCMSLSYTGLLEHLVCVLPLLIVTGPSQRKQRHQRVSCFLRAPGSTREKKPKGFSQPETHQCLLQSLQAELVLCSSALLLFLPNSLVI